jgi:hypothetical protein
MIKETRLWRVGDNIDVQCRGDVELECYDAILKLFAYCGPETSPKKYTRMHLVSKTRIS